MIEINSRTFETTAKVVFEINESAPEAYDTWECLEAFMRSMAHQYMEDSGFFSTAGFILTAYDSKRPDREPKRMVEASIMPYCAEKYLGRNILEAANERTEYLKDKLFEAREAFKSVHRAIGDLPVVEIGADYCEHDDVYELGVTMSDQIEEWDIEDRQADLLEEVKAST